MGLDGVWRQVAALMNVMRIFCHAPKVCDGCPERGTFETMRVVHSFAGLVTLGVVISACYDDPTLQLVKVPRDAGAHEAGTPIVGGCGGAGCGGSDGGADSGDAGRRTPTPVPDPNYPTTHAPIPLLRYAHGNVLDAPKVVTVTFDNDTSRDFLEGFGDSITGTAWWDAVSAGYCDDRAKCVGHGAGAGHVRTASPGSSLADIAGNYAESAVKQYIAQQIQSGTFPVPDANTIYMLYTPDSLQVTLDGKRQCVDFGAFHNSMTLTAPGGTAPVTFTYAIMPRCSNADRMVTFTASHELVEAATDPIFDDVAKVQPGWTSTKDAWDFLSGGEVADRCFDFDRKGRDVYHQGPYTVTRSFSNLAASQSHDPCVPAPSPDKLPYFNVAPEYRDMLLLKVGEPVQVSLVAFTDAPLPAFNVDVLEQSGQLGMVDVLSLSLDRTTAQNGQELTLTITLNSSPGAGYAPFQITSTLGPFEHHWQFIVQPK